MKFMIRKLLEEYEKQELENKFTKKFYFSQGAEIKELILEDQKGCITGWKEFEYLGVKIDIEGREESYIKNRFNKSRTVTQY